MTELNLSTVLIFENEWSRRAGSGGKDEAIRVCLGVSPTVYYQRLNALLDDPEACAFDPMLVKRLRRLRAMRRAARITREQRSTQ